MIKKTLGQLQIDRYPPTKPPDPEVDYLLRTLLNPQESTRPQWDIYQLNLVNLGKTLGLATFFDPNTASIGTRVYHETEFSSEYVPLVQRLKPNVVTIVYNHAVQSTAFYCWIHHYLEHYGWTLWAVEGVVVAYHYRESQDAQPTA